MTTVATVTAGAGADTVVNNNNQALAPAGLYGIRMPATAGLVLGYYGGQFNGVSVADGTVNLSASATNYVVAHRTTGVVTAATTTTNWLNTTTYLPLYEFVAGASSFTIAATSDKRQAYGGAGGGGGSAAWGGITGTLADQADLMAALAAKQDSSTIGETIDDRVAGLLVAGTNVTLTYNDVANTLTIAAAGGGGGGGGLVNFTESINTAAPNATEPAAQLIATNAATDVDFVVAPKGAGALQRSIANNLASGGNKRGQWAVDWSQTLRSNAARVASGFASVIAGGYNNRASGSESCVPGGSSNDATGNNSIAGGGSCTASANYGVAFGVGNTASTGQAATVFGSGSTVSGAAAFGAGSKVFANGAYSVATGILSNTRGIQGARMHASYDTGAAAGAQPDAQDARYVFGGNSSGVTPRILTANHSGTASAAQCLSLPQYATALVKGTVLGRAASPYANKSWTFSCQITRDAGNISLVGTPVITPEFDSTGALTWSIALGVNTSAQCLEITVTGGTGLSITWGAVVESTEVFRS